MFDFSTMMNEHVGHGRRAPMNVICFRLIDDVRKNLPAGALRRRRGELYRLTLEKM